MINTILYAVIAIALIIIATCFVFTYLKMDRLRLVMTKGWYRLSQDLFLINYEIEHINDTLKQFDDYDEDEYYKETID